MKKRIVQTVSALVLIMVAFSMSAFAQTGSGTVYVRTNLLRTVADSDVTRTGSYSYIKVKALSVFPAQEGVEDTYTKCRAQMYVGFAPISEEKVLTENITDSVNINEGELHNKTFKLCFSGNHKDYDAYITYWYNSL